MGTLPVITLEQLRRSILSRQGLIVPFADPLDAVRAMVAVQTQYAASLPVAVATRVKKATPGWDEQALEVGGRLIKSWSLRHTLHAHTSEDHQLVVGTLGAHLYPNYVQYMEVRRSIVSLDELQSRVLEALTERPLSRRQLHEKVPELKSIDGVGWGLDVMGLAFQRRVCLVGRGSEQKFCHLPETMVEPRYGELLRRYLVSYGPATKADFAHWTGLKGPQVQAAFSELEGELEHVKVEGQAGAYFSLAGMLDQPTDVALGVRLLAKFDPLILSLKDKSLFISPESRTRVFRKAGQVEAVVLVEGRALGTWRMERKGNRIDYSIEAFQPFGKRDLNRLNVEAVRISKALGVNNSEIHFV